jgi:hypothetical protein
MVTARTGLSMSGLKKFVHVSDGMKNRWCGVSVCEAAGRGGTSK